MFFAYLAYVGLSNVVVLAPIDALERLDLGACLGPGANLDVEAVWIYLAWVAGGWRRL